MAFDSPASDVHVLVVDDDVDTVESTALLFEDEGVRVSTAYDGMAAAALAKELLPDLILLDLAMPEFTGYDVLQALQAAKLPKQPFVIAVSGYGDERDKRRCIAAGFDLHLTKPFDPPLVLRLLDLLRDTSELKSAMRQVRLRSERLQAALGETFLETAGHLVDLAATTRNPVTKQRLWERARKVRELVATNFQARQEMPEQSLVQVVLYDALDTALASGGAQMGNIQLLNPQGHLEVVAQRGFNGEFVRYFASVREDDTSPYGRALRYRTTIAIEDVESDAQYATHRAAAASANYRALCSSPLIVPDGRVLGILSSHFRDPHTFSVPEIDAHAHRALHTASLMQWAGA